MKNELILKRYWFNYYNPDPPSKETDDIAVLASAYGLTWVQGVFVFTFNGARVSVDLDFSPFIFKDIDFDKNGVPIKKSVDSLRASIMRYAESTAFNKISNERIPIL